MRKPPTTTVIRFLLNFSLLISGTKLVLKTSFSTMAKPTFSAFKTVNGFKFSISYQFRLISPYNNKNSNTEDVQYLSCITGRNLIHLLATNSKIQSPALKFWSVSSFHLRLVLGLTVFFSVITVFGFRKFKDFSGLIEAQNIY